MASLMKHDVKVKVFNETPKTLIPSNGVVNWDGVLKFGGRPEGDHVMHPYNCIKRLIAQSLAYKCSYANDIIVGGPMM
jgi:hypothetical protein